VEEVDGHVPELFGEGGVRGPLFDAVGVLVESGVVADGIGRLGVVEVVASGAGELGGDGGDMVVAAPCRTVL